jgi:Rrf2 family transcriptional regulator, cysteine metabolism repressor
MNLSVKSDYAARAVLSLARHYPSDKVLRIEDVAREQDVPRKYLPQILAELKGKGIIESVRGRGGGCLLGRPPAEITLGDVLRAVHGRMFDAPAIRNPKCPPELRRAWKRMNQAFETAADAITFQQLLDEGADKGKMYYI